MSRDSEDGKTDVFGERLPGTGGDFSPTDLDLDLDVEGHKPRKFSEDDDADVGAPKLRAIPDTDEQDVEGHLFRTGPTTEGEFSRRGPGENPHGDR
jgi:hypothetical protein